MPSSLLPSLHPQAHPIHISGCLVRARRARVPTPLKNWLIAAACLAFTSGVTTAARGPAGFLCARQAGMDVRHKGGRCGAGTEEP